MIYENIRNLREDNDKKQRELAEYLNVSQNTYSQYETGVLSLSPETLIKLADYYNTSIDYLLGQTNEKKPYKKIKKAVCSGKRTDGDWKVHVSVV